MIKKIFITFLLFFCIAVYADTSSTLTGDPNKPETEETEKQKPEDPVLYIPKDMTAVNNGILNPIERIQSKIINTNSRLDDAEKKRTENYLNWQHALVLALRLAIYIFLFLVLCKMSFLFFKGDTNTVLNIFLGLCFFITVIVSLEYFIQRLMQIIVS